MSALRATLGMSTDREGVWRWACHLEFKVTAAARATWFPEVQGDSVAGVDPGCSHPLTWATDSGDIMLSPELTDLARIDACSDAERRLAIWGRHQEGYQRAWEALSREGRVHIEDTNWHTLTKSNPNYIRRAREGYLWTWLSHFQVLAQLTGSRVKWIPPYFTSRICSRCQKVAPRRPQGGVFHCGCCGLCLPSDINAARNLRQYDNH